MRAALIVLESLIECGVRFSRSIADGRFRIVIDSVTGNGAQRRRSYTSFKMVFDEANDILDGKVCNVCGDRIERTEQQGEPVCFHCWLNGQDSPQFQSRAVREPSIDREA